MAKNRKTKTVRVLKTKGTDLIKKIQKRDGTLVPFDIEKVANAIYKAMIASNEGSDLEASMVANKVFADLVKTSKRFKNFVPDVEGVQDSVEKELMLSDYVQTAKNYILYRKEHEEKRKIDGDVPAHVKKLAQESRKYFKNTLGEFVYYRTYAKWIPEESRRETWVETVDRYVDFMKENLGKKLTATEYKEVREAILKQEVMPSMRLMQFAGEAARRTNVCAYNCSYTAPESFEDIAAVKLLVASSGAVEDLTILEMVNMNSIANKAAAIAGAYRAPGA